jgi:small subunit ribosomal protein S5
MSNETKNVNAQEIKPSREGKGKKESGRRERGVRREREQSEFEARTVEVARVTRVMAGGKRMRFRALVVLGDRAGRIGYGLAKGADVTVAVNKAQAAAKRKVVKIALHEGTIPHAVTKKFKAAKLLMKPAPDGTGIIAGGAFRTVFELAGVRNVVSKSLGSGNKINAVKLAVSALNSFKKSGSNPA